MSALQLRVPAGGEFEAQRRVPQRLDRYAVDDVNPVIVRPRGFERVIEMPARAMLEIVEQGGQRIVPDDRSIDEIEALELRWHLVLADTALEPGRDSSVKIVTGGNTPGTATAARNAVTRQLSPRA